ncbi:MAG: glycosyltransferase family 2 protein [Alphaproteobacteria bacterium]|nr:glycosyltransferase family 2 protein [Alphaproteobacteria bacterium]
MELFKKEKQGNLRKITILGKTFTYTKKAKMPPHINRDDLDKKIAKFDEIGIRADKREKKLIVSLTSFPPRMNEIHYTLYSLLNQSIKPDEVVLWLCTNEFPNREADIPKKVLDMQKNGLTIKWSEVYLRSYAKLVPSLKEFPDAVIVTADDDIYYPKDWLKKLYQQHLKYPRNVICHRCHRAILDRQGNMASYSKWPHNTTRTKASFFNFATGVGGVLYPVHSLYKDVTNIELFKQLAPYADDIWFWAMEVLAGTKVKTFLGRNRKLILVNPEREMRENDEQTLAKINIAQDGNNKQMQQVLNHYPQILEKLKNE